MSVVTVLVHLNKTLLAKFSQNTHLAILFSCSFQQSIDFLSKQSFKTYA